MPGLLIMLPIAIVLALTFLGLFFWSMRNGDIEDAEMASLRVVMEDDDGVDLSVGRNSGKESPARSKVGGGKSGGSALA
ncbi:MAG: cbb3-type cytochrome oxidase assembly protein CcoS [Leptospirales bacterium]|nr:cbb3-type cytochrome oxidase assembly protein CcoS [Leptospirales bacterium]